MNRFLSSVFCVSTIIFGSIDGMHLPQETHNFSQLHPKEEIEKLIPHLKTNLEKYRSDPLCIKEEIMEFVRKKSILDTGLQNVRS